MFGRKPKVIPWKQFFDAPPVKYVALKIKPDTSARNWRSEDIARTIADMFKLPIDRVTRDGATIRYRIQERAAFEIVFNGGKVYFFMWVPENLAVVFMRRLQSVWPESEITQPSGHLEDRTFYVRPDAAVYELVYQKHDMYALHIDAKDNTPLPSILEGGKLLQAGESAHVMTYFEPIHWPTWAQTVGEAWRKMRAGHAPRKWDGSPRQVIMMAAIGISEMMREIVTGVSDMFTDSKGENMYAKQPVDPEATKFAMEQLTNATRQKAGKPAIRTRTWVAAQSEDKERAGLIARTMAAGFNDLAGDNELTAKEMKRQRKSAAIQTMNTKQPPKVNITCNYMSTAEAGKFIQVGGRELQEAYPEIDALESKEIEVAPELQKGGMLLGTASHRGTTVEISQPIDDHDQLCLPEAVIAGMGQGKTRGKGANTMFQAVKNGFGAVYIDPAKGEVAEELAAVLEPEQLDVIEVGKQVIGLDWREVEYSPKARNRLANTVIGFFNTQTDEAGARTVRYLRAAVMGMQTGRLKEIITILTDSVYRNEVIHNMNNSIHKETLISFGKESEAMQNRIMEPIMNRLDTILGDEFLAECMDSDDGLDFVQIMSQPKAFVINVRKSELGPEAVDLIVNLISTKIDLAMTLRPEEKRFPFYVILDEPHQFMKSARIWKAACVESRKWRVKYTFLFHSWEQIPKDLREIMKAALPHYTIYPSSKATFQDLREEIYPFTVEDGLRLKRFHAINVIRAGTSGIAKPVIVRMTPPPSLAKRPQTTNDTKQAEAV